MVAAHHRIRNGDEPVAPNADLSHAANFLYMLHGETPSEEDARVIDKDLVLHAEHGSNASTFAARVAASTRADFYSALTAAVSVLKGPKHGGAAEGAMQMAQEVGSVENAESYVSGLLANGQRVTGFGHAVYKDVDPRSVHLKADAKALGERKGETRWYWIIEAIASTSEMKRRARLGINPNVDLWSGAVYSLLGDPGRPVRPPVRDRPNAGMGAAHNGAVLEEGHPPAEASLHRTDGPGVRAHRATWPVTASTRFRQSRKV